MRGLALLQRRAGNRAVASLLDRPPSGPVQRAASGQPADLDVGFNPQDIAHRLVEAIDQKQVKSMSPPIQRHVDLPAVVAALDGRTADQIKQIDAAYAAFEHRSLRTDLLAGGESGFPTDLTPAQLTRVRALLDGTRAAPGGGEQARDLAALNRLDAEAAELHHLLHGDLPDADVERVMTLLRRDPAGNAALIKRYRGLFDVELAGDLGRLGIANLLRATMLLAGVSTAADSLKVSALRSRVAEIDSKIAALRAGPGIPMVAAAQIDQLRKQRRSVVGEIEDRVEQAGSEARQASLEDADLTDPAGAHVAAEQAAKDRMRAVLGGDVTKAAAELHGADAAALRAVATGDPSARAAAHLLQLREAGNLTAAAITETLRGLREQAEQQTRQAMPLDDPATQAAAARSLADDYLHRLPTAYDAGRPGDAPSFDQLVGGTGDLTEVLLNQTLRASGGRPDPVSELRLALAGDRKDLETVKRVLRGRTATEIDEIKKRFPELETELFGRAPTTAGDDNEAAEAIAAFTRTGGKATGADRLALEDYLQRPQTEGGLEEARYVLGRAEREYQYAIDNGGFTGWWRDHWGNEARALMDESITNIRQLSIRFARSGGADADALRQMRLWRATIRGDRAGYEKANAELRATFEAVAAFALQIALTALLTPAAAAIFRGAEGALAVGRAVKMVRGVLVDTVATIAANAAVQDNYGLAALERDLLGSLGSVIGSGSVSKLSGLLGERFVTSLAGKEIISAASTVAGIEATAVLEGRGLTEDLSVRSFLLAHGQGKIAHAVGGAISGPGRHAGPARPGTEGAAPPTKATPDAAAATHVAELPGVPERVSMALPEPTPQPSPGSGRTSLALPEPAAAPEQVGGRTVPTETTTPESTRGTPPRAAGGGPPGGGGLGGPAPEGSRLPRAHQAGDVVEVRFDYAEERYDRAVHGGPGGFRSPFTWGMAPALTEAYQGRAAYDAVRVVEGDVAFKELTVRLHLRPGAGVTTADLTRMRGDVLTGVEGIYNDPHHRLIDGDTLRVRVEFVADERAAHGTIDVERARPGTIGRDDQYTWYVGNDPIVHAHEVGHHLGLTDEYVEAGAEQRPSTSRDRPDAPGVRHDRSFMGGIAEPPAHLTPQERFAWTLGGTVDPGSRMHTRHLAEIADSIAEQKLRNELVERGVDLTAGVPETGSLRPTDYDAIGPHGEFQIIAPEVAESGMVALQSRLMMLRYQAAQHRVQAEAIFGVGTPRAVLRMARHILGDINVSVR